ncbi:homoserine kinase [Flavimarina sp. Hel_I_48]|uniref:homoserine kinase n=1 Tax=Flavimarina sp. Hel_I_48 TaxID=1392488 RepID=UPI000AFD146C|nr:homoserine kinase [Flavimarina sp. Hel_I_48]
MKELKQVRVFSPATVANVNCGFDVLGFALHGLGDEMVLRKVAQKGIKITSVTGAELPMETSQNVSGVAGEAMLNALNLDYGFEIEIHKKIRLGSGVGSSAASAAGVVFGINQFLKKPFSNLELTRFGMKGEAVASGNEHADNVAPCIYGGFTLITGYDPLKIVALPVPRDLFVTIIHPHISIKTREARELLPQQVSMQAAIQQSGNLAGLVAGLYENDYELIGTSTQDALVEGHRKALIPHFDELKATALKAGGLAFGISGSGPSMFTLTEGIETARNVEKKLVKVLAKHKLQTDSYVSSISTSGNQVLERN